VQRACVHRQRQLLRVEPAALITSITHDRKR
jgi:hypothetical protein